MLRLIKNRKAQNTMEYALLIAVVIGVFSAMQLYMRRGMQARLRSGSDNISAAALKGTEAEGKSQEIFGTETQYEPYYITGGSATFTTTSSEGTETGVATEEGGKKEVTDATVRRTGTQVITGASEED